MHREPLHERTLIAQTAARLMAEHGIHDYSLAKRKAARQLGLPLGCGLPGNAEIDQALREYRALFLASEQDEELTTLRQQALQAMIDLDRFRPVLVGGVASGAITQYSDIEFELYEDCSKEFEQFLLKDNIVYETSSKNSVPIFTLYAEPANVIVRIVPERLTRPGSRKREEVHLTRKQLTKVMEKMTMAEPVKTD